MVDTQFSRTRHRPERYYLIVILENTYVCTRNAKDSYLQNRYQLSMQAIMDYIPTILPRVCLYMPTDVINSHGLVPKVITVLKKKYDRLECELLMVNCSSDLKHSSARFGRDDRLVIPPVEISWMRFWYVLVWLILSQSKRCNGLRLYKFIN